MFAIAGAAGLAACGHLGMGGPSPDDARIVFHNETLDQADVYASRGGTGDWVRIGTVFPNRVDTIVIHADLLTGGGIVFRARLLAKNFAPSSGNVAMHSGDILDIRLPMDERSLVVFP